jgi:hypothetical protein
MEGLGRRLQREADRLLSSVWMRCETVHVPEAVASGDVAVLSQRLAGDLGLTAGALVEVARRSSAEVLRAFAMRNRLQLPNPRIDALPAPDVLVIAALPTTNAAARHLEGARGFTEGAEVGERLGLTIGAIVDFVIPGTGMLVSGFLGRVLQAVAGAFGSRAAADSRAEADRQARHEHLRLELAGVRARHRDDLAAGIDLLVDETLRSVTADLDDRIVREIDTVDESIGRLASVREQTTQATERRRTEIDAERLPLQQMLREVDDLAARALRLGGG